MDTPKYGETLKFMYIKYQPILVVLPKVYEVSLWCNQHNLWKLTISRRHLDLITRDQWPAVRPNHERSVADPAVILCLNRVSFICLFLFMCHEVSHHILEYPFQQ